MLSKFFTQNIDTLMAEELNSLKFLMTHFLKLTLIDESVLDTYAQESNQISSLNLTQSHNSSP